MIGLDGIKNIYQTWRVNPVDQQNQQRKQNENQSQEETTDSQPQAEDEKPHIDEYA
jgi:hypothetical protein